jgi:hypothetical protein
LVLNTLAAAEAPTLRDCHESENAIAASSNIAAVI